MSPGQRVEVESSGIIDASLENLWDLVSDFNNVAQWHPDVTKCHLESGSGQQAGAEANRLFNVAAILEPGIRQIPDAIGSLLLTIRASKLMTGRTRYGLGNRKDDCL